MLAPPPLFVVFPNAGRFLAAARKDLGTEEVAALERLVALGVPPVTSVRSLALLLGISPALIGAMARNPSKYYRRFEIPSGRKTRVIYTPRVALKVIQRWFGFYLARQAVMPAHVHGFVPGRSTVTAARVHCPSSWVLSVDVRNFFGSVTVERVAECLRRLGYPEHSISLMVGLTTLPMAGGRGLPQGAPSSPVLANLAFQATDAALLAFATSRGLRITRYADDLSFSGDAAPDDELPRQIERLIVEHGWGIAQNKTRLLRLPQKHPSVLGLLVSQAAPRLPKRYRNRLRLMRHLLQKKNLDDAQRKRLSGHVSYAESVD